MRLQGHGARMASGDWKAGVGANGETHFNVFIVSEKFTGKSLLQRHQLVNQASYCMGYYGTQNAFRSCRATPSSVADSG